MNVVNILKERIQNEINWNKQYMREAATREEVEGMEEETYTYEKVLRMIKEIEAECKKKEKMANCNKWLKASVRI